MAATPREVEDSCRIRSAPAAIAAAEGVRCAMSNRTARVQHGVRDRAVDATQPPSPASTLADPCAARDRALCAGEAEGWRLLPRGSRIARMSEMAAHAAFTSAPSSTTRKKDPPRRANGARRGRARRRRVGCRCVSRRSARMATPRRTSSRDSFAPRWRRLVST